MTTLASYVTGGFNLTVIVQSSCIRKIFLLFLITAIFRSNTQPASAATQAEYEQSLASTARQLQQALQMERKSPGSGKQILERLQGETAHSLEVDVDGTHIRCDQKWIATDIHNIAKLSGKVRSHAITRLIDRVNTLSFAASKYPGRDISPSKARSTLRRVLAGYEYQPTFADNLYKRLLPFLRNITEALQRVFGSVSPRMLRIGNGILIALAGLAFAAVLVFLVMRIINGAPEKAVKRKPEIESIRTITRPTMNELLSQAERDASEERYREALRAVYIATLLQLDKHGAINYTESGTNWEYMRSLSQCAGPEKATIFRTLTTLFDESFYGNREISASDYASGKEAYHRLGDAS